MTFGMVTRNVVRYEFCNKLCNPPIHPFPVIRCWRHSSSVIRHPHKEILNIFLYNRDVVDEGLSGCSSPEGQVDMKIYNQFKQTVIAGHDFHIQSMAICPPTAIYDSLLFSWEDGIWQE